MRAHQIMTRDVATVTPKTSIVDAASTMLNRQISGLPVVDDTGKLVGIVSESDFLRRSETGTERRRRSLFQFILGPGRAAADYVHEHGRKVGEIMTPDPLTALEDTPLAELVQKMEENNVKRLPILRDGRVVGIVTRSNLLRAVASLAREVPDPTADDDHIRDRVLSQIERNDWRPLNLQVTARNGIVHLYGIITDDRSRDAAVVAAENVSGVREVHDHLCWIDVYSGAYLTSAEDGATFGAPPGLA